MEHLPRLLRAVACILASTVVLTACASTGGGDGSLSVTTSETPTANAKSSDPIKAPSLYGAVEDPAMGVTMHFQGAQSGEYGGTRFVVAVTNHNKEPLAPESLGDPELTYDRGSRAKLLKQDVSDGELPLQIPLDRPLGVGATANVQYTFDVAPGSLSNAEFQFGNIIWSGNLAG